MNCYSKDEKTQKDLGVSCKHYKAPVLTSVFLQMSFTRILNKLWILSHKLLIRLLPMQERLRWYGKVKHISYRSQKSLIEVSKLEMVLEHQPKLRNDTIIM